MVHAIEADIQVVNKRNYVQTIQSYQTDYKVQDHIQSWLSLLGSGCKLIAIVSIQSDLQQTTQALIVSKFGNNGSSKYTLYGTCSLNGKITRRISSSVPKDLRASSRHSRETLSCFLQVSQKERISK